MFSFKSTLVTGLAIGFMINGCTPKQKAGTEIPALDLRGAEASVFSKYFETPARDITAAESEAALAALGLDTPNPELLSWSSLTGEAGTYTYTDLVVNDGDAQALTIGTARFYGVRQIRTDDGETLPDFDRVDFEDIAVKTEALDASFGLLSIANPSPDVIAVLVAALEDPDSVDDDVAGKMFENSLLPFDGLRLKEAALRFEDGNRTSHSELESFTFGVDRDTQRGDTDMGAMTVNITSTDDAEIDLDMDFAGMSARAFYAGQILVGADMSDTDLIGNHFNIFRVPYDSLDIGRMKMDVADTVMDFEGLTAAAKQKGDVTTIESRMKPLTISLDIEALRPRAEDQPDMLRYLDLVEKLDFETMVFRGTSRTVLDEKRDEMRVEAANFVMEDAMEMDMAYTIIGLKALQDFAVAKAEDPKAVRLQSAVDAAIAADDFDILMDAQAAQADHNAEMMEQVFSKVQLASAKMALKDDSLIERGLKLASEMSGQSVDTLKRTITASSAAAPMLGRNAAEGDLLSQAADALVKFVTEGGTFRVEIDPKTPLTLSTFITPDGQPADDFDVTQMGIAVSHTP